MFSQSLNRTQALTISLAAPLVRQLRVSQASRGTASTPSTARTSQRPTVSPIQASSTSGAMSASKVDPRSKHFWESKDMPSQDGKVFIVTGMQLTEFPHSLPLLSISELPWVVGA